MTIKKENPARTGKFMDFLPGEVFSFEDELFMKHCTSPDCSNNAAALSDGGITYFNHDTVVTQVMCTLSVK